MTYVHPPRSPGGALFNMFDSFFLRGFMADSSIPKDIADSLKSIFTNINTERISEILVGVVLCFIGFVLARIISNTFIRTVGSRFNAHQRLVWRRGIFYFIFLLFIMTSLKEAGFKLSISGGSGDLNSSTRFRITNICQ